MSHFILPTPFFTKAETEVINVHTPHLDLFKSNPCIQKFLSNLCLCKSYPRRLNEIKHVPFGTGLANHQYSTLPIIVPNSSNVRVKLNGYKPYI